MNSFIVFITSFVLSLITLPFAKGIGKRQRIIDLPSPRKIHKLPTIKTGGIMILVGYTGGNLISGMTNIPLLISLTMVFIMGILGDRDILPARKRLIVQAFIAIFFILSSGEVLKDIGIMEIPYYIGLPFTIISIVGLTNAYNIIDGMNGLCAGLGIISISAIGILGYIYGVQGIFLNSLIFASATTGFLIFNLRGKLFLGDNGSYMIGFGVATISIMLSNRANEISPFAFFLNALIPIFDTLFSIWRRRRLHKDSLKADKRHIHHMLLRRYGSTTRALIVILIIQVLLSGLAVLFHRETFILILLIILSSLFLRRLWFRTIKLGRFRI